MSSISIWFELTPGVETECEVSYFIEAGEKPSWNSPGEPGGILIDQCRPILSNDPLIYGQDIWDSLSPKEREFIEHRIEEHEWDWA